MERNLHLEEMGERIIKIRKKQKLNQIQFYKKLFPDMDYEEENIKKKMNAIENGKRKKADYDLLLRICEKMDVSLDYLFGFKTEYPNYENEAAAKYTGLSAEAVRQLHFWSKYKDKKISEKKRYSSDEEYRKYLREKDRKNESAWILYIASKLFEMDSDPENPEGTADLSILYDLYMMTLDTPELIRGIPEEIANSDASYIEKAINSVSISADAVSFTDQMGENHQINIGELNRRIWEDRLMKDVESFIAELRKNRE